MSFDEEPDAPLHGECAAEITALRDMLKWAYRKLARVDYARMDDALMLDAIKSELTK